MKHTRQLLVIAIAAGFMVSMASAAPMSNLQKRVLLLYDSRSDMLGNIIVDRAIRSVLNDAFDTSVDVRSEYFEAGSDEDYRALADWLGHKYDHSKFNVVVAIGANALQFANSYSGDLFQGADVVFWGRKDGLKNWPTDKPVTGVVAPEMADNLKATADLILKLQPDLRQLVIVAGAAEADQRWEAAARSVLPAYEDRLSVSFISGPTLEELQTKLAQLPPRTAVVFLTMGQDGAGRRLLKSDVLRKVVQTSSAPVYSTSVIFLDTGIVGGALINQETLATETASVVTRLLRGEPIRNIPVREGDITPTVNWPQLRAWNIPENRIPPGTAVLQRSPTTWELYRWPILSAFAVCVFESMLILALLIQSASRKRAEKSLRESRRLLQSTIDALHAQIVLVDGNGKVAAVNESWLRSGEGQSDIRSGEAPVISSAIHDLLAGTRTDFTHIYECDQAGKTAWFQLRMNRFLTDGMPWVVMEHENITDIKRAHDEMQYLSGMLLRARDDERRRIARDLHDVTAQNLATMKADITRVQNAAHDMDPRLANKLREAARLSDQVIKELRTLSYVLHPPLLDELGLVPALQWFVRGFMERSGIQVDLVIDGEIGRLPTDHETTLFRVAQESLSNIHRHSGSSSAIIHVTQAGNMVTLQIKDNGRGISQKTASHNSMAPPGVGIMGMGERLRQLRGQLDIESSDHGTTVTATIPTTSEVLCFVS